LTTPVKDIQLIVVSFVTRVTNQYIVYQPELMKHAMKET